MIKTNYPEHIARDFERQILLNRIRQANLDRYMAELNRKRNRQRENYFKAVKEGKITPDTSYEEIIKIMNA